jgi:hypothetical protein
MDMAQNREYNLANIVSAIVINGAAPKAGERRLLFNLVVMIVVKQHSLITKIESQWHS